MRLTSTLLTLLGAALFTTAAAQTRIYDRPSVKDLQGATRTVAVPRSFSLPAYSSSSRSYENPQLTLDATTGISYDYRELQSGCNAYQLYLTNCEMDGKSVASAGQYLNVVLFAPDSEEMLPPAGTYTFNDEYGYPGGLVFGSNVADYADVFPHPEDPESGFVGYIYELTGGTIEIAENNGNYNISAHLTGVNTNSETFVTEEITVTYSGTLEYVNPNPYQPYTPLNGDVVLENLSLSGGYTEGDYNLAFYNVPLDDEGFVIGPGDLMGVELFVEPKAKMDINDLVGTFTISDILNTGVAEPGKYCPGIWTELYGIWMSFGTNLTVFQKDMSQLTGLASGGTITITRDGDIFTVLFDLVTPEEHHITGTWTGPMARYITDLASGIDDIEATEGTISGGRGCITAPEGARVFTLSGIETRSEGLLPGLYIVKCGNTTKKVIVK